MQPNKNLVFYLAGDDEQAQTGKADTVLVEETSPEESATAVAPKPSVAASVSEQSVGAGVVTTVLASEVILPIKNAQKDVDWIATLENLRHQRRHVESDETTQDNGDKLPQFSISQNDATASTVDVLKVNSVIATQLYRPAADALAAGKDLDRLSLNMQEAQQAAQTAIQNLQAAHKDKEAGSKYDDYPVWNMDDLSAEIKAIELEDSSKQMADLKLAANQVPIEEWEVETTAMPPVDDEAENLELMAKAKEVAEKTALSLEERHHILDGFLSLWQRKHNQGLSEDAERKVVFHEAWQERNLGVLQTDGTEELPPEQVLWLKTRPEEVDLDNEALVEALAAIDTEVTPEQPLAAQDLTMYAPIHVHISAPEVAAGERLEVIAEADLLAQLAVRLKPYFVDMLAGMVRTELNKQTTLLVQRLQQNIEEEIPTMVDEVLQENLHKVLAEIKRPS